MSNPLHALCYDVWHHCLRTVQPRVGVDIGANNGGYVKMMLDEGIEKIHAFEPVPNVFKELQSRYADDPRVYCNRLGMSDYKGVLRGVTVLSAWTIGLPDEYGLSVSPPFKDEKPFDVELVTLDGWFAQAKVGAIKLDVDGYEHKILAGGTGVIARSRPPILCELGHYIEKVSGSSEAFIEFLNHMEYNVVSMDGRVVLSGWAQVKEHYPNDTTFDVMLLPMERTEHILKGVNEETGNLAAAGATKED